MRFRIPNLASAAALVMVASLSVFGRPTGAKELRQKRRGPFWVFDRFIDFENGRALLSITLNKRGRVYGLFLVPATVPGEEASPNMT